MKKIVFILVLVSQIFAFEGAVVKTLLKVFSRDSIELIAKKYGNKGVEALEKLSAKYGKNGLQRLKEINAIYGKEGVNLVAKYGDIVVRNRETFNIAKQFGDKGFYIIKRFPYKSVEFYNKFGDKFVVLSDKFGTSRVIGYLDDAKQYNADGKIITFLDKFGEKANIFLDRHWGKLLASGFVLLNADDIIKSSENIAKDTINKTGDVVTKSVSNVADSNFGILVGIAFMLFIIFKYGWDLILQLISKFRKK